MSQEISPQEDFDHVFNYQTRVVEITTSYNQVVILAGYAAFFAVWSAVADKVAPWITLTTGGLIILSVTVFVGWNVANMVYLRFATQRMMKTFELGLDGFLERVLTAEKENGRMQQKYMRFWAPVVVVAGSTGGIAAILLAVAAFINVYARLHPPQPHPTVPACPHPAPRLSRSFNDRIPAPALPASALAGHLRPSAP